MRCFKWLQSSPQQALPQPIMTSGQCFQTILLLLMFIGACAVNWWWNQGFSDHYAIKTGYPRVEKNDPFS